MRCGIRNEELEMRNDGVRCAHEFEYNVGISRCYAAVKLVSFFFSKRLLIHSSSFLTHDLIQFAVSKKFA